MRARFKSSLPDWFVTANRANGCESHCWRDLNFCTDVSPFAAFTPRKAPDHAGKPLEHFRPTKLGSSESLFAPGLRHVEAGVLEEDSRPVTVGFEPVDHLRIDDRAGRARVCEPAWRFAFQHLAAHHDPVEAGLGVRRHAKRVALGRRQMFRTVGYGHGEDFWRDLVSALRAVGYDDVLSIEHEDEFVDATEGLEKAIGFLQPLVLEKPAGAPWWEYEHG